MRGLCAVPRRPAPLVQRQPILGISADGGRAERVLVKPEALVRLPSGLPVEYGCLVEPLAVSAHGLEVADIRGGERVALVGAGSIGLTAAATAVVAGAEVAVEARHDAQSALDRAVELVRPAGTVVFLSTLWDPVALPGIPAMMKEIMIKWAFTYAQHGGGRDLDTAAALLARRPEIAETLITHRFPLGDAPATFSTAAGRAHGAIKIPVEPG